LTWFKVSDDFHAHPKVMATDPAALGLWTIAGSWSSANHTGGFVPDYVLMRLLPDADKLASELVTGGLWRRVRGGHRYHDWSIYNPTEQEAKTATKNKSIGGKLGNHRRWHEARNEVDPKCPYCPS
jgi:hypothetical protein